MSETETTKRWSIGDNLALVIVVVASLISCPFICEAQRGDYARCLEGGWTPDECRRSNAFVSCGSHPTEPTPP